MSIVDNTYTKTDGDIYNYSKRYSSVISHTYQINDWKVYQGYNEISKVDFFRLVQNEELLNRCLKADEINKNKKKIGTTSSILGIALGIAGIACLANIENESLFVPGLIMATLGSVGLTIGYIEFNSFVTPDIPIQIAMKVADDFNHELQLSLKRRF